MKPNSNRQRIPFNRPFMRGQEIQNIYEAIERGQLAGDGIFTERCNSLISELSGSGHSLLTHSCTAALEMAAILCDLKEGDEVIMPSFTFVSTANAVVLRGAVPVFVDIDEVTLNICPAGVRRAITAKTKAVFVVHYAGFVADVDALIEICSEFGLYLVEDAAQAFGSSKGGRPAGSFGDLAAFSFHETKNVISGEGGALCINNEDMYERAEIIRQKGTNRKAFLSGQVDKYTWVDLGSSFLPGELVAAFLYGQLQHHEEIRSERMAVFDFYQHALADLENLEKVKLIKNQSNRLSNGHLFYLLMNSDTDRQLFIQYMESYGIACPFHYVPLHSSPAGRALARTASDMKVTDDVSSRLVRLPLHSALLEENQLSVIVEKVWDFFRMTERTSIKI